MKQLIAVALVFGLAWLALRWYRSPNFGNGAIAADFVGYKSNGDSLRLSDFRGQLVLLDFWGSWCGPCRDKNKDLVRIYKQFGQRDLGDGRRFHIISIGVETDPKRWQAAIEKDSLYWPHHVSDLKRFDDHIALLYGVKEIPTTFLLDENGQIIGVNQTYKQLYDELQKRVR